MFKQAQKIEVRFLKKIKKICITYKKCSSCCFVGNRTNNFCFSFSQSKKNYEVKCKEADEAEQGAEKTNATSKNPEKVK